MHELSIAKALIAEVHRHLPRPTALRKVRRVKVRVGALQAVEPAAIQLAWQAVRLGTPCDQADLELKTLPWELHCNACGRWWTSTDPLSHCCCGHERCEPRGSDEIVLMSIDVDTLLTPPPDHPGVPCASPLSRTC